MKKSIFYCDIEGTFTPSKKILIKEQRALEIQNFVDALDFLCEATRQEEILFGFISTNPIENVQQCIKDISPFIEKSKHIKFGTSFSEQAKVIGNEFDNKEICHTTGKAFQIIKNLEHIKHDENYKIHADEIEYIFFADDSVYQHHFLSKVFEKFNASEKFISIIPGGSSDEINTHLSAEEFGIVATTKLILKYVEAREVINSFQLSSSPQFIKLKQKIELLDKKFYSMPESEPKE